nr:serine protease 33-like [Leptinotarsa decemlineata]
MCIDEDKICNGFRDCPQGDDERQCVTIAADIESADKFPYYSEGYLMVRKYGKWGKLCIDNFENVVTLSHISWQIPDLGKAVCKSMTYQTMASIKTVTEHRKDKKEAEYFELTYSFQNETKSNLSFKKSSCSDKKTVKVECQSLECGARPQAVKHIARVVGGGNAGLGAWPWQAALYKEGEFQCGGTLLSDRWLVSAGHCFYHSQEEYWVARLGALRRGTSLPSPYEQLRPVIKILVHPGYVDSGFINDISLLQLESPVVFSDYVRPVCLPPPQQGPEDGQLCTIVGWGQLFEVGRIFPDTLQEVQVPIISTAECRKRTLFLSLYRITDDMFCAGYERGGRDACLGDSGGPLMCPESNGRWTLQGITSNGYGCARANRPGVYTKVANYVEWITLNIGGQEIPSENTISTNSCSGHRCPLGECLPESRLCNGYIECSDGSDERNCENKN